MDGRVHLLCGINIIHWSEEIEYMYKGMYFSVTEFSVNVDPYLYMIIS